MIYLIDTIGVESGMHKYDEAFHNQCLEAGEDVRVLSNFDSPFVAIRLSNYYHGNIVVRLVRLLVDLIKMIPFRLNHPKDCFIYQSFGLRTIDILFCMAFWGCPRFRILVHDLFQITGKGGRKPSWVQKLCYNRLFGKYICHSVEVKNELECMCLRKDKDVAYFPHIEYSYSTDYNPEMVAKEVVDAVNADCINVLFFGQVRMTKGIDILLEAWNYVDASKFNLIVAGSDKDGILSGRAFASNIKIIPRYISDDELNYLFSNTDTVVLPYREIYQSGVLEAVVHFRKRAILSPITPFRKYVGQYPSFAVLIDKLDPKDLAKAIESFPDLENGFLKKDLEKYAEDHDIRRLLEQL